MWWSRAIGIVTGRGSLRSVARWLFLATLIAAPWCYGGTTAWSIELIDGLLGLVLVFWIASLLVDRRRPLAPWGLIILAAIILLFGWAMALNAHAIYDTKFRTFVAIEPALRQMPGSVDYVASLAWMVRATVLLGAVCFVAELAQRQRWLLRLWWTIAIAGGSIALLGLIQKGTGAHMIFWETATRPDFYTFFATYYYHANAGAFLNLALPPTAGLVLWTVFRQGSPFARAAWISLLVLISVSVVSNTSRMAQVIGAVLIVIIIARVAPSAWKMVRGMETRSAILGLLVLAIAIIAVAQAARLDQPLQRWQKLSEHLPDDARWVAVRAAWSGVPEAGALGFGAGTFRSIFPHYQQRVANLEGTWRFLHNDYLETVLEWGWAGTILVGALFFGGIGFAIRNYFTGASWSNRQRILLPCFVLALIGVAIHAAVDFPVQILSIQLFVATYLGVCWGSGGWGRKEERRKN
jgi:hypothetical protein